MSELDLGVLLSDHHYKKVYLKDNIITKVFDHTHYSFSDVCREAMIQDYAKNRGFKAPKTYSVFYIDDNPALTCEYIDGKTMAELIEEDPDNKKKYIQELVRIQNSLLRQKIDSLKLPRMKDKLGLYIQSSSLNATTKYDLRIKLDKKPDHFKFCHGNFCPHNLVKNGDDYYILDWGHSTRGNASADAAATYLLFLLDGDEKGANMYLKEFCKRNDIKAEYVEEWISLVSASKVDHMENEEKKAQLMKNIHVVVY